MSKATGGKLNFALLLSVNQSLVLARDRDAQRSRLAPHPMNVRFGHSNGEGVVGEEQAWEEVDDLSSTSPLTVENAKRLRSMRPGMAPSLWHRTKSKVMKIAGML